MSVGVETTTSSEESSLVMSPEAAKAMKGDYPGEIARRLSAPELAEELDAEWDLDFIVQRLRQLPSDIRSMSTQVYERKQVVDQTSDALMQLEAGMTAEIAEERGEDGKLRFSNESMRRSELVRRKANSAEYSQLLDLLEQARAAYHEAQMDLKELEDEHSSLKYIANLQGRRLLALTGTSA